jgi:hypothetical protein
MRHWVPAAHVTLQRPAPPRLHTMSQLPLSHVAEHPLADSLHDSVHADGEHLPMQFALEPHALEPPSPKRASKFCVHPTTATISTMPAEHTCFVTKRPPPASKR